MFNFMFYRASLRRCGACLLLFLSPFTDGAFAQNANKQLSLSEAVSLTLAEHPQLHQFAMKRHGLIAQRLESNLSPALNLGIDVENFGGSGNSGSIDSAEITLSLSSVIELGSKRSARVSVSEARIGVLESERQVFTLDVLGNLTAVFVSALENQALIELAKEASDISRSTLDIVLSRSSQGAAPESDVKRARAAAAQSQLQLESLIYQYERKRIHLASFWGSTSLKWQRLSGNLFASEAQPDFSDLYQRALSSPAIELFASENRLKEAELKLAKTQARLSANWQVGLRRFEETGDSALVAGVSIPLFGSTRSRGAIAVAVSGQEELAFEKKRALQRLHAQLFEAYSQRQEYLNALRVFQSTVIPELESALKLTKLAYENGRYSYQDWIAVQQELLQAKQSYIQSAAAAALNQAVIEQLVAEPINR